MKGKFIVIEGVDGSGKTTIVKLLRKTLENKGYSVKTTKEPTNGPVGKVIRRYMKKERERDVLMEALLFAADRRWHNIKVILPSLEKYDFVICDRYIYSSIAYQTIGGKLSKKFINYINMEVTLPDYSFFIDISPEESLKRIKRNYNIFEKLEDLRNVYKKYKELVKEGALIPINGKMTPRLITEKILEYILGR